MAKLINGNGSEGITAQVDADFWSGLTGGVTGIMPAGERMAATIVDNQPRIADGVLLTKEGRRVQIDSGDVDDFTIPAGVDGVTAYYIIGYKLVTAANELQTVESFVQQSTADGAIEEGMIRDGDTEVYISLYRIIQTGTVNAVGDCLLPVFSPLGSTADSGGDDSGDDGGDDGGGTAGGEVVSYTSTWKGLSVSVDVYAGKLVFVNISGNTNAAITTKSAWATVGNYAANGLTPRNLVEGYTEVNSIQSLRYYWGTDGVFKIGYGRNTASGSAENVSKGYVVNLHFAFAL